MHRITIITANEFVDKDIPGSNAWVLDRYIELQDKMARTDRPYTLILYAPDGTEIDRDFIL